MKFFSGPAICLLIGRQNTLYLKAIHRAMSTNKVKVAVCQMTSTPDKEENLQQAKQLIAKCQEQQAQMVFLPEGFDSIQQSKADSISLAESLTGPTILAYRSMAKVNNLWLSLGGFQEKVEGSSKLYNTHLLINNIGEIVGRYRKLHLFDVDIPDKVRLKESDYVLPGEKIGDVVSTPAGNVGLGVCYDMRFPEFSTILRQEGANILTYPSAFTVPTGEAHWETLLRARAIENQCYVIAAAQVGRHHAKRASYGHSMVVDPWGKVICEIDDGVDIATADIDLEYLQHTRQSLPVHDHKRHDVYHLQKREGGNHQSDNIDDTNVYSFAQYHVPSSAVFHITKLSFAFVNRKPVLPGHMLVSPLRIVRRFTELSSAETADLFEVVQRVGDAVSTEFQAESLTLSIQDGPDAGQSVEHVHVHILPRRKGDFERNDDIYDKLSTHDKTESGAPLPADSSLWRTEVVMAEEAAKMRKYFPSNQKFSVQ